MGKPNKIYNLTIVFNDETDQIEYLQETVEVDSDCLVEDSVLIDFSDYWDEETIEMLKDVYYLAEA